MPANNSPQDKYKESQVKTANQGKLIVMCYDAAIRNVREAIDAMASHNTYDVVNAKIIKAEDIVTELMLALNMDAGEVASRLYNLYNYIYRQLIDGNIRKDSKSLDEALRLLIGLRDAWVKVAAAEAANRQPNTGVDIES